MAKLGVDVQINFFIGKIKGVKNENANWEEVKGMEILICSIETALFATDHYIECPIQKDDFDKFFEFIRKWECEFGYAESETLEAFKKEYIEYLIPGYGSPAIQDFEYDFVRSVQEEEIKEISAIYREYFGIEEGE